MRRCGIHSPKLGQSEGHPINLAPLNIGDMIGKAGPASSKLFTYLRYNAELSNEGLAAIGLAGIKPVQKLDSIEHIPELQQVGQAVAKKISVEHFAGFLP